MRVSAVVASLLVVGVACVSTQGCSSNDSSDPSVLGSTVQTDRGKTEASRQGESIARAFLGLRETPQTPLTDEETVLVAQEEALAGHIFDVLETQNPGTLDHFGTELASKDPDRMIATWVDVRTKINAVADSAAFQTAVQNDPLFKDGAIQTQDYAIHIQDSQPVANDNIPNLGKGPDGRFGDEFTGPSGAAHDAPGLVADIFSTALAKVDNGTLKPDPDSRLGAYAATAGYPKGTVGNAVHNAIGTIYVVFGTFGEEKIGRVFNDPQAKALFNDPVNSPSGLLMAETELRYWNNVAAEDPYSPGGRLGSAFVAPFRNFLQKYVFGSTRAANKLPNASSTSSSGSTTTSSSGSTTSSSGSTTSSSGSTTSSSGSTTSSSGGSNGGDGGTTLNPTDCGDKTDGWWCLGTPGFMAYCQGKQIALGCACAACATQGTAASCPGNAASGVCPD